MIKFELLSKHQLNCMCKCTASLSPSELIYGYLLHYLNIIFTFCAVGIGVGIPVTFMLTAIISSLLTLLITYLCLTRGKCHKSTSLLPIYDTVPSDTSVELKSNAAYGQVTTVSSDTSVEMKSNVAYGQVTTVSSDTSVEMKSNVAYGQVTT